MIVLDNTLRQIADVFIGDVDNDIYKYKTGGDLVQIFNNYFDYSDTYVNGFPSRWFYVAEKIQKVGLSNFFKKILSSKYLRSEESFTRTNVDETIDKAVTIFNEILDKEDLKLIIIDDYVEIEKIIDGTIIGAGGFATVYRIGNKVKKVLKTELRLNESACHRFKREYEITDSIKSINGIMRVDNYDSENYSYEMEYCDYTLETYLNNFKLNSSQTYNLIDKILVIMSEVHQKDVIHRDLTPNNIFIRKGNVIIGDFGLGKDLNADYSRYTQDSRSLGQYRYVAPEQISNLKIASKPADIYSLGKIINFILNDNPDDSSHELQYITEKCTSVSPELRFANATELLTEYSKYLDVKNDEEHQNKMVNNIAVKNFSEETNQFISSLSAEEFCDFVAKHNNSSDATIYLFKKTPSIALDKLKILNKGIKKGFNWNEYDNFSKIAYEVLAVSKVFDYDTRVEAAILLDYNARSLNRFFAQSLRDELLSKGLDTTIEEILN